MNATTSRRAGQRNKMAGGSSAVSLEAARAITPRPGDARGGPARAGWKRGAPVSGAPLRSLDSPRLVDLPACVVERRLRALGVEQRRGDGVPHDVFDLRPVGGERPRLGRGELLDERPVEIRLEISGGGQAFFRRRPAPVPVDRQTGALAV